MTVAETVMELGPSDVPIAEIADYLVGGSESDCYEWEHETAGMFRFWFEITPDHDATINDIPSDVYGRVEHAERCLYRDGYRERPSGFDGGAELIRFGRGEAVWWQPPHDVVLDSGLRRSLRRTVEDILEYGFVLWSVVIERCCEHCGSWDRYSEYHYSLMEPNEVPDVASVADIVYEAVYNGRFA